MNLFITDHHRGKTTRKKLYTYYSISYEPENRASKRGTRKSYYNTHLEY